MRPVEFKIPAIVSSHFNARRWKNNATINQTSTDSQRAPTPSGAADPASLKPATQPTPTQTPGPPATRIPSAIPVAKGPRPFVSTYGKPSALPKWPPDPSEEDTQQQAEQQQKPQPQPQPPSPSQFQAQPAPPQEPQINICEEERQAGSGQSSPASSEESGPLEKQDSGVFTHPLAPPSHTQPPPPSSHPPSLHSSSHTPSLPPPSQPLPPSSHSQPLPPSSHTQSLPPSSHSQPLVLPSLAQPAVTPDLPPHQDSAAEPRAEARTEGSQPTQPAPSSDQGQPPSSVHQPATVGSRAASVDGSDPCKVTVSVTPPSDGGGPQTTDAPGQTTSEDGKGGSTGMQLNQRPAPTYR